MRKEQLEYAAARYGTPLYIFDLDMLTEQTEKLRSAFGKDVGLCYAMKANPFLTAHMAQEADRIEVCSMGEFEICRKLRIPPEKLFISGVLKKKEDIFRILEFCRGRCAYTVESVKQLHYFVEWSDAHMVKLRLYPRLTSGNQFGMDEDMLRSVFHVVNMSPYLEIEGIHYFSGTQKRSLKQLEKEISMLDDLLIRMRDEWKASVPCLEYGPGIAVPYFQGKAVQTYEEEGLTGLRKAIDSMRWKGHVTIELGRAIAAECGYYLTQIRDIKKNGDIQYCIVDGGNHHINYDGQIRGMYEPHLQILPGEPQGREKMWTVCGALCTANDVLCRDVKLTGVQSGKVLVFERTGAYSAMEGMSLFLSHPLPSVVTYQKDGGWRLLRKQKDTYLLNMPEDGGKSCLTEEITEIAGGLSGWKL